MEKLKPCPFCGEATQILCSLLESRGREFWEIGCASCIAGLCMEAGTLICFKTREAAVAAWNRRAADKGGEDGSL